MSGSVTPARRSRGQYADDEDAEHGRKRARLGEDEDEDNQSNHRDSSESPQHPPLPDSFRRSPKGKGRALVSRNAGDNDEDPQHQPGSIVRVTLKDFVTYTHAEFFPGPNLNMIIGPNGTGKSTLVCAICLGLGWQTSHLGRAKDIGEFVKHGAKQGSIEIELAADPSRHSDNQIITCRISRDNKTEFLINGRKSNKKNVLELARSLSIQVDNLCQFLPQDRVVEFAALSPVDLLVQTQKAAAPQHVSELHDQLKYMRKQEKAKQVEQQATADTLKSMQDRQDSQEGEVGRLRERTVLQERQVTMEKFRPFAQYVLLRRQHREAKESKRAASHELKRLEDRAEPNLRAESEKEQYLARLSDTAGHRARVLQRSESDATKKLRDLEAIDAKIEEQDKEVDAEKKASRKATADLPRLERERQRIQDAIDSPPAPFDPTEINAQYRDLSQRIRTLDDNKNSVSDEHRSLREQARQRQEIIRRCETRKESLQSQLGRQTNRLEGVSRDTADAWRWVTDHRDRFASEVFGPAMIECAPRNPQHADAIEAAIGGTELKSITVTCREDFDMLQKQLYTVMKLSDVSMRSSTEPLTSYRAPYTDEERNRLGLECWIIDLLEGPEPVLAMLCENRGAHKMGFTTKDLSAEQNGMLQEMGDIGTWLTPRRYNGVSRRPEYGALGISIRSSGIGKAKLLTDAPVDTHQEQELNRALREAQSDLEEIVAGTSQLAEKQSGYTAEIKQLQEEQKALQEDKAKRQRDQSEYNGLTAKRDNIQAKWDQANTTVNAARAIIYKKWSESDERALARGQSAIDYSRALEALRRLHEELFEAQIMHIEAKSDLEQLHERNTEERRQIAERKKEVDAFTLAVSEIRFRHAELSPRCAQLGETFTDAEKELLTETNGWEPDRLETEIQSIQAQLESLHGGNDNAIREYEQRAVKIERKQAALAELEASLAQLHANISNIREKWEPELDGVVAQISVAFAENFSRIHCAGEVSVYKDEDFANWAIQIKVKFREHEELSVLDSHRQSGGERAVSTIFYLMALQSLARAPFRVVDEINQGMDPRNERLVHSRMVDIACAEHTSQYFLITPKLLNGLDYHPNMKVHCIASGEYVPADHRELDFGALAQKALAVRASNLAAAAS